MLLDEFHNRNVVLLVAVTPGSASKEHVLLCLRKVLAVLVRPENTPGVIFLT